MATVKRIFGFSRLRVANAFPSLEKRIVIPKGTITYLSKEIKDNFGSSILNINKMSKFKRYVEPRTRANLLKQKRI